MMLNEKDALEKAYRLYHGALEWIRVNPDAWSYMKSLAGREADAGRLFSSRWLVERVREKAIVDSFGAPVRIRNDYTPVFGRLIFREYPDAKIENRSSIVDLVM